jgi:tetratricopeptide (TPR) repeat protein
MRRPRLIAALALLVALPAAAQPAASDRRAEYEAAFQDTLKNPSDPETAFRFARLAVRVGDIRGAISALERLLLLDADQPNVKLELGVLYARLGSLEAARGYLESAKASGRADAATRHRADQVVAGIDDRTRRSHFSGEVRTMPTAGPPA